jgi:hypothetical protein
MRKLIKLYDFYIGRFNFSGWRMTKTNRKRTKSYPFFSKGDSGMGITVYTPTYRYQYFVVWS